MRDTKVAVFVHVVWATWDRLPWLTDVLRPAVYRAIGAKCVALAADVIAIGGTDDHVHLLVRLPATLALAELVGQIKGASSHLVTHQVQLGQPFKWQGSYGAFSVTPGHLSHVIDYITNQAHYHATDTVVPDWEHGTRPGGRR